MVGYVGIDPGETGAVALIREDDSIEIWDWPGDERALVPVIQAIAFDVTVGMAVIEHQQSMPKQGVSSTFKLGVNYGMWLAAAAAMAWPLLIVRPNAWKSNQGYPVKDKDGGKKHSLALARRFYPQAEKYLTRGKDHNRAEALLLARYAMRGAVDKDGNSFCNLPIRAPGRIIVKGGR